MKKGILYGLGVGPGDPEFLTIKSVKFPFSNYMLKFMITLILFFWERESGGIDHQFGTALCAKNGIYAKSNSNVTDFKNESLF